jgi:hypothetical protein
MYVTYRPEDGDEQRWEFDPARVRASKAEMIEKRYGDSWDQWQHALQAGNMSARRVLLWHLMSLDHMALRFEDVPDFYAGELEIEFTAAELRTLRAGVEKSRMTDAEKAPLLAAIDTEIDEAVLRDIERGVVEEGKAPSKRSGASTPSRSQKS